MGDNTTKIWKENGNWKSKEHHAEYMRRWNAKPENKARNYEYWQKRKERYLQEIYALLGGAACRRCRFDDRRALQLDHINGGGNRQLRALGDRERYYKYVLAHPNEFQVLCANHNWIKRHEEKEGVGLGSQENKRGPKTAQ